MSHDQLLGALWSVLGLIAAVVGAIDSGGVGVMFAIGGMVVSATWYLGIRFARVEARLAVIEGHIDPTSALPK